MGDGVRDDAVRKISVKWREEERWELFAEYEKNAAAEERKESRLPFQSELDYIMKNLRSKKSSSSWGEPSTHSKCSTTSRTTAF